LFTNTGRVSKTKQNLTSVCKLEKIASKDKSSWCNYSDYSDF